MAYNPYSDLRKIYNYKTEYNKAKSANDTAGMKNAQDSAAIFYQNLRDNGYSAYADQMSGYTEEQARDWVNTFDGGQSAVQVNAGTVQPTQTQQFTQPVAPAAAADNANGSIYQGITQDVYNWVQGITDNKTMYDNSKFTLQDGNYQQYADLALPYYESLRAAGRSDIADYLNGSNTPQALEYLRSIGIELDPDQQDLNTIVNTLLTQPSQSLDMNAVWQQSQPILDYINGITQPDAQTQAANQQAMDNMNTLFSTIMGNNQQIGQDSAALNELIKQYMGEQTARYDDLYNWLKNENFYESDTAKSIMDYYNAMGGKAADEATAEGIAQNAGNIDSYAAANALRQQLDFTNAGNAAVLNQYNAQAGNMLDTLRALGVDVGDAQDRLADILGSNQAYNAELAGQYNDGTAEILGLINQNALAGNTAAVDALQSILGLYEAGMTNDTNRYLGQLGTAGELLANRESLESAERQLSANNAANLEMLNRELASNEQISANELAQAMQLAGIEKELTLAELENAYKIASAGHASNERISANELAAALVQVEANNATDRYVADLNASTNKYLADTEAASNKYAVDAETAIANAKNAATTASTSTTEPAGFNEFMDLFFALRPDVLKNNSIGTEDYVDELTIEAIAKAFGWDDKKVKELEEQVTAYKDNVVAGLATDSRANGVWAMPNVTNN